LKRNVEIVCDER